MSAVTEVLEDSVRGDLAAAVQDATQAAARVHQWRETEREARAELAALEAELGDALLQDPSRSDELVAGIDRCRGRVQAAAQAAAAAFRKWQEVSQGVPLARASILLDRSAELWAQVAARQSTTDRLLAALAEHEGVQFGVTELDAFTGRTAATTATGRLIEEAQRLGAEAVALVASVRGEGAHLSRGPLTGDGQQIVCVHAHAACEPLVSREFYVTVDGQPVRQEDGRVREWFVTNSAPALCALIKVPATSVVQISGRAERASSAPAE